MGFITPSSTLKLTLEEGMPLMIKLISSHSILGFLNWFHLVQMLD